MATHRISILGANTVPDATGECYQAPIDVEITTLATFPGSNLVFVLKDPSADTGFYGSFMVPENYTGTCKIGVVGVLDGTTGTTSVDFEWSYISLTDNEAVDAAYTENVTWNTGNTSGWTNEDVVIVEGSPTSANFTAGDIVMFYLKRDSGTDDFVGDFHVLDLYFEYSDA